MTMLRPLVTLAALCLAYAFAPAAPIALAPDGWTTTTTGNFQAWTDRRALLVLHHPWDVSENGFAATTEREVSLPEAWTGPVILHFYMSDDYDGSTAPVTEGWLGQMNLPSHRFKQVLVNDEVVWEQDVADTADGSLPVRFAIPLEGLQPGVSFRIAFRLIDKAGSMERLPGDHRHVGTTDGIKPEDPWKFMIHLYVGDVTLAPAGAEVPPGSMPAVAAARNLHETRWPIAPEYGATLPVTLPIHHAPVSAMPFPIQTGVPLPLGAATDPARIQFSETSGALVPSAARIMNTWPDGSIRTAVVTALAPAGAKALQLVVDNAARPAVPGGGLRFESIAGSDGALRFALQGERGRVEGGAGALTIDGLEAALFPEATETLDKSPIHREVEVRGRIKGGETDFGRFVLRATTFAGTPAARLQFRVFHDLPGTRAISRVALRLPWSETALSVVTGDLAAPASAPVTLAWPTAEGSKVTAGGAALTPGQPVEWLGATGDAGSILAVVRDAKMQHPLSTTWSDGAFTIDLFSPAEAEPVYAPHEGEAKRWEIWVGLPGPGVALASMVEWMMNPPGLFSADYACATGAFGPAAPHDDTRFPELTDFMRKTYGEIPGSMFYTTGIRHGGDLPYSVEEGTWRNGYYDVQQGLFSEYLMTGDARWFDHLEASVRHIMDIDVCHASAAHPDWVGSVRGYYGKDHSTDGPWNPTQRIKGMLNYARLTGDRDARAAALGVADSAVAAKRAMGSVSVRDHAGVLYALVAAYDETRDPEYLEGARELAHDAMKRIDPRRGTYAEIHGNYAYRGNVPWMVAQLMEPMYDYFRQSGDVSAAEAVVAMAESILAENRTRGVDGDVHGYSHNPHFVKNSSYHISIAPAIGYAWELTGDGEFMKQVRAMYNQTIAERTVNSVMNCYWNTHTLLYYLEQSEDE